MGLWVGVRIRVGPPRDPLRLSYLPYGPKRLQALLPPRRRHRRGAAGGAGGAPRGLPAAAPRAGGGGREEHLPPEPGGCVGVCAGWWFWWRGGVVDGFISCLPIDSTTAQRPPNLPKSRKQFENLANFKAHFETTGPEIYRQTRGHVDAFVCAAGTGGTLGGVSVYLKQKLPHLKVGWW